MDQIPTADLRSTEIAMIRDNAQRIVRGLRVRLLPVLLLAVFCWGAFSLFRAGLLLGNHAKLVGVGATEIARCLANGMRYDCVPCGYLLIPLMWLAMFAPRVPEGGRWFRRTVTIYTTAVVLFIMALECVGAAFFMQFYQRLNWIAVDYLGDPVEVFTYIWEQYPTWLFLLMIGVAIPLTYMLVRKVLWRESDEDMPWTIRVPMAIVLTVAGALASCGGSFYEPLGMDKAYSNSSSTLISELTFNNAFTLGHAIYSQLTENQNEMTVYQFPPKADAQKAVAAMVYQAGDKSMNCQANPLWRHVTSPKPAATYNVVVIIMEGMTGPHVGCVGSPKSLSPNLDKLAAYGLYMNRCYAVGARTSRGITGVLCSHPDIGGSSILKQGRALGSFLTLPMIFADRGYQTCFVYGGDPSFDNMAEFLQSAGIRDVYGKKQLKTMGPGEPSSCWGLADELMLARANEIFQSYGDQRFFSVVLTVSNHEPFDVPLHTGAPVTQTEDFEVKKANGIIYSDWALGQFFEKARKAPYFKNTIFVLVADHGRYFDPKPVIDIDGFHIPFIIYAPGIMNNQGKPFLPPARINTVCSQTDVAPTLLGLMGGPAEYCWLGRNMLEAKPGSGFALLHDDQRLAFVTDTDAVMLPPMQKEAQYVVYQAGRHAPASLPAQQSQARRDKLQEQMLSYYRMALELYLERGYGKAALDR